MYSGCDGIFYGLKLGLQLKEREGGGGKEGRHLVLSSDYSLSGKIGVGHLEYPARVGESRLDTSYIFLWA